jgi:hypothetical protein
MSDAEKKQLASENKCFWCEESGHFARDFAKNPTNKDALAAKQSN